MILHCSFEELSALGAGARRVLADSARDGHAVAAPPQLMEEIEALLPRLTGDLSIGTLAEQRVLQRIVGYVLRDLRRHADAVILDEHPAAEAAVLAHFEFAHVLTLMARIHRMGEQMAAMIEVMTGQPPDEESIRRVSFPD